MYFGLFMEAVSEYIGYTSVNDLMLQKLLGQS